MFPQIIEIENNNIEYLNNYIDCVRNIPNKIIKINKNKLSKLVLKSKKTKDKKNDILLKDIILTIDNNYIIMIKHLNKDTLFIDYNNIDEIDGNFNIKYLKPLNYSYLNEEEIKNVKRSILITTILNERKD